MSLTLLRNTYRNDEIILAVIPTNPHSFCNTRMHEYRLYIIHLKKIMKSIIMGPRKTKEYKYLIRFITSAVVFFLNLVKISICLKDHKKKNQK